MLWFHGIGLWRQDFLKFNEGKAKGVLMDSSGFPFATDYCFDLPAVRGYLPVTLKTKCPLFLYPH